MLMEIISVDQGIASISGGEDMDGTQLEELKKGIPENAGLKDLVFFYIPDRDWIVINRDHTLYDDYLQLSWALRRSAEGKHGTGPDRYIEKGVQDIGWHYHPQGINLW